MIWREEREIELGRQYVGILAEKRNHWEGFERYSIHWGSNAKTGIQWVKRGEQTRGEKTAVRIGRGKRCDRTI